MSIAIVPPVESPATSAASDNAGKATAALVLGILGTVTSPVPLLGVPLSIVGLVMAAKGTRSSRSGQARAGLVLSIVGLAVTSIFFMVGFAIGVAGTK